MVPAFLLTLTLMGPQDVPDAALDAICQLETGTRFRQGIVIGQARRRTGACGPFQLSRAVLRDLHASPSRASWDGAYGADLCRRWLRHLLARTGDLKAALAAYRYGLQARQDPVAQDYARRALALISAYEP